MFDVCVVVGVDIGCGRNDDLVCCVMGVGCGCFVCCVVGVLIVD